MTLFLYHSVLGASSIVNSYEVEELATVWYFKMPQPFFKIIAGEVGNNCIVYFQVRAVMNSALADYVGMMQELYIVYAFVI